MTAPEAHGRRAPRPRAARLAPEAAEVFVSNGKQNSIVTVVCSLPRVCPVDGYNPLASFDGAALERRAGTLR